MFQFSSFLSQFSSSKIFLDPSTFPSAPKKTPEPLRAHEGDPGLASSVYDVSVIFYWMMFCGALDGLCPYIFSVVLHNLKNPSLKIHKFQFFLNSSKEILQFCEPIKPPPSLEKLYIFMFLFLVTQNTMRNNRMHEKPGNPLDYVIKSSVFTFCIDALKLIYKMSRILRKY